MKIFWVVYGVITALIFLEMFVLLHPMMTAIEEEKALAQENSIAEFFCNKNGEISKPKCVAAEILVALILAVTWGLWVVGGLFILLTEILKGGWNKCH